MKTVCGFDEHLIASCGSQSVIKGLEGVQIEEQERVMKVAIPLRAGTAALQAIEEEAAIRQIGQCVVQGVVSELLFGGDTLGNVTIDNDQLLDFSALVLDRAGGRFEEAPLSIFVTKTILQALADAGGACFAAGFENLEAVVGMNLLKDGRASEFLGRVAENFFVGGAVVKAMALAVDQGDHVRGVLRNDAEQLFAITGAPVGEVDPSGLGGDDGEGEDLDEHLFGAS